MGLRWPLQTIREQQARAEGQDSQRCADAALVLGARVLPQRPCLELKARLDHAHQLWQQQRVPVVMVSGGGTGWRDEIRVMTRYLLDCGLPGRCILPCAPGDNTLQSLTSLARLQHRYGMRRFLVVSSGYHAARLYWIARHLQLNITVSAPASTPESRHKLVLAQQQLREWMALLGLQFNRAIRAGIGRAGVPRRATAMEPTGRAAAPAADRRRRD